MSAVEVVIREQVLFKWFSWMVLKSLLKPIWFGFERYPSCFCYQNYSLKTKQTRFIFVSSTNFEREMYLGNDALANIRSWGCSGIACVNMLVTLDFSFQQTIIMGRDLSSFAENFAFLEG